MFSLFFFFLFSKVSFLECKEEGTFCCLKRTFSSTYYRDGDLVIGGFFPLVLRKLNKFPVWKKFELNPQNNTKEYEWLLKHYYQVLALMFAIEEINRNPNLLPNITLGFHIYNAYANDDKTLESSLMWLSGQGQTIPNYSCDKGKSVVVIGGDTSDLTIAMGSLLELYKFPQLHSFLKNIHFNNSAGKQVVLDAKRKSMANYDILNYVTFSNDTEVLVKVGKFTPQATDGEEFTIQEKAVVWATRLRKVKDN
ncbi:vomeronasal type-2 receptor 26-like [Antechinus flavipes]|uniref:vomeronasal type-2 receptor 26-like n=1 Tax=Antechinus flavipes TaxID=38775 RepID=UPI00223659AE|nr:vomeronasal type-2 receptor 26-like [Antechinus flavipes]